MYNIELIKQKGMSIIFWNIQSLYPKFESVKLIIEKLQPDLMCFSEPWLNPLILDSDLEIRNYSMIRNDRKTINDKGNVTRGGVLCIYINKKYKYELLGAEYKYSVKDIETLSIRISIKDTRPIYIASVYRPPSGDVKNGVSYLYDLVGKMDEIRHKDVIFGGDFNINFKTNNTEVSELKKFINS